MNIRDAIRLAGHMFQTPFRSKERPFENTALPLQEKSTPFVEGHETPFVEIRDTSKPTPNDDPEKIRIHRTWKTWTERKAAQFEQLIDFIRRLFGKVVPAVLTPQERDIIAENKKRLALDRSLRYQAQLAAGIMQNVLARLGICSYMDKDGRRKITHKVVFTLCEYSPLSFRYYIDAGDLPWGVSIESITNNAHVTQTLSAALRHPVKPEAIKDPDGGVDGIITVEIAGTNDIPNMVLFRDVLTLIPEAAPPLAFTVGRTRNGRLETRALESLPHLLIGGQTLGGKSNMLNVIICCHLARNTPDQLRVLMVDMKGGGIELMHFEGVAHLLTDTIQDVKSGIAQNIDQALGVLYYAAEESEKRQHRFMEAKLKNIEQWNRKHRKSRLPRLVVYIDELALLMPEDELKLRREVMGLIRKIASTARAAGVHLVAATQSANKTILNETIKVNLPGRIVFSVPDAPSSILLVNDGSAVNLFPAGRCIWKHGTDNFEAQTPFISNSDISQIVDNASRGQVTTKLAVQAITPEQIIDYAVNRNDGIMRVDDVFYTFRNDITKADLLALMRSMDNNIFTVNDVDYIVIPGLGSAPRTVIKAEDYTDSPA
jgi:DNA segregation ATPase FtsK/SpoIIIE-like protein